MASGPISQSSGVLTPANHAGEARLQKPSFRVSDLGQAPLHDFPMRDAVTHQLCGARERCEERTRGSIRSSCMERAPW